MTIAYRYTGSLCVYGGDWCVRTFVSRGPHLVYLVTLHTVYESQYKRVYSAVVVRKLSSRGIYVDIHTYLLISVNLRGVFPPEVVSRGNMGTEVYSISFQSYDVHTCGFLLQAGVSRGNRGTDVYSISLQSNDVHTYGFLFTGTCQSR